MSSPYYEFCQQTFVQAKTTKLSIGLALVHQMLFLEMPLFNTAVTCCPDFPYRLGGNLVAYLIFSINLYFATNDNVRHRSSCIVEAIRRFPIDLCHIINFHGAVASDPLRANTTLDAVNSSLSHVSFENVLRGRRDYKLHKAEPLFTDTTGFYYDVLSARFHNLSGTSSVGLLCIENYLVQSEKERFDRLWVLKLGNSNRPHPAFLNLSTGSDDPKSPRYTVSIKIDDQDQLHVQNNLRCSRGLKKAFIRRIGDWPIYSFFIAFVST